MVDPKDAKIIVVEDNPDNLFLVETLLKSDVRIKYYNGRASGWQFFKLLDANPGLKVDVVLLDIQIPHEDGYAVIKKIRDHPALSETKVIAVTANVMPHDIERARFAGFDGFIGKPIDADRFPNQIRRILAGESVWEPR